MTGSVTGIGVGPGDPELITLKGYRAIQAADLVAYPAPETGESLARAVAAPHIPAGVAEYPIRMPMTVERFPAREVYDAAAAYLSREIDQGRRVAVLCEGDPFFYGSFMYLFGRLAERHPVTVVPGVSSLTACAAALSAPLCARNDVLSVLPAPLDDTALERGLGASDAVAIVKLGRHFARVRALLDRRGLLDDARYVERATMAAERVVPIREVDPAEVPYFSMILVHRRGEAWT